MIAGRSAQAAGASILRPAEAGGRNIDFTDVVIGIVGCGRRISFRFNGAESVDCDVAFKRNDEPSHIPLLHMTPRRPTVLNSTDHNLSVCLI